jgi:cytosine/adenosine deaminase-related metal-dependent hydrolase
MPTLIRNVRPWGGPASDVRLASGRIAALAPHDPSPVSDGDVIDGRGRLLVPSFSDVHVHLDSTRLGLPFRPHTGGPGVWTMMLNDRRHWRADDWPVDRRAAHALGLMIARGTTRVRSYAQIDVACGLDRFEAVLAAREAHAGRCEVQVIAFPQAGLLREDGTVALIEQALRAGADMVGGIDPCQLDRDPVRHLDIVFGLAEKYQVGVDIHLHEPGELGVWTTDLILERTRATGMQGRVSISHGYALGGVSEATSARLIEQFAELDIAMATVAPSTDTALPLDRLTAAGVRVGLGEDGQRDYWSPYGNADMLDRTWQLAFTNNYRADTLIEHCLVVATIGGASLLHPDGHRLRSVADRPGLSAGDPADLLLLDGECLVAAVMDRPQDRTVIHEGRVVADGLALV